MNKKILSILTGVSALAAAGLLSIIPASVSHAEGPSQAPAAVTVRTTVYVHDVHLDDFDPSNPIEEDCEFEYTYSGDAVICDMYSLRLTFSFDDDNNGQSFTCEGSVEADYEYSTFSQSDSITEPSVLHIAERIMWLRDPVTWNLMCNAPIIMLISTLRNTETLFPSPPLQVLQLQALLQVLQLQKTP